jgi:hypothetical protein
MHLAVATNNPVVSIGVIIIAVEMLIYVAIAVFLFILIMCCKKCFSKILDSCADFGNPVDAFRSLRGLGPLAEMLSCGRIDEDRFENLPTQAPHPMFWLLIPFIFIVGMIGLSKPKIIPSEYSPIVIVLVIGIPCVAIAWKIVERIYQAVTKTKKLTYGRRSFIAKRFCQIVLMAIQQLTVPLAQFWIENVLLLDVRIEIMILMAAIFVGVQIVGLFLFYFFSIRQGSVLTAAFSENEDFDAKCKDSYQFVLECVDSSATSNFEIFRYKYRYWILFEMSYEILNALCINICEHYGKEYYWFNFALYFIYFYLHATLRPSFYPFHNWLNIIVGMSGVLSSIGVLEELYGSGKLNRSVAWPLLCLTFPFGFALIQITGIDVIKCIFECIGKKNQEAGQKKASKEDIERIKMFGIVLENVAIFRVFLFSACVLLGGILFLHVSSIADRDPPSVVIRILSSSIVALFLMILVIGMFVVLIWLGRDKEEDRSNLENTIHEYKKHVVDKHEKGFCENLFCWCRGLTIHSVKRCFCYCGDDESGRGENKSGRAGDESGRGENKSATGEESKAGEVLP